MYKNMKYRVYNNTLNPLIWNPDNTLKPEIRDALLKIAQDFYADSELTAPIEDVYILGSIANYNWSPGSDIDLHVLVDFSKIGDDHELVKKLADNIKANWNKKHDIRIKGFKVETYIQDINETNRAMGVYSVKNNQWIKVPQKMQLSIDKPAIQKKYNELVLLINNALKTNNMTELKRVLKLIYDMREVGLSKEGEFSTENLVFKLIRSKNHLEKIKNAIPKIYDAQHSLKES